MSPLTITERLARIARIKIKPDLSGLQPHEHLALLFAMRAVREMDELYLEQCAHINKTLIPELLSKRCPESSQMLDYLLLLGRPWDVFDGEAPFVPAIGAAPKFGSFYPENYSKEEHEIFLANKSGLRDRFEDPHTVIRRDGQHLVAVPYSKEYRKRLGATALWLQRASNALGTHPLADFMEDRAQGLLTNDYAPSEQQWIGLDGYPFTLFIGPYEDYFDGLLGKKTAFEGYLGIPNKTASLRLANFGKIAGELGAGIASQLKIEQPGPPTPLVVCDDVLRGGEAAFGDVFIACNLPNDPQVRRHGTRNIISWTMTEAKCNAFIVPTAERLFRAEHAMLCNSDARMLFVLGHELAHGIGPNYALRDGEYIDLRTAFGNLYSPIEEAKADTLGMEILAVSAAQGLLTEEQLKCAIIANIAGYFKAWRKGFTTAHDRANLLQYNWLREDGALHFDATAKCYDIDCERALEGLRALAKELMRIQLSGDPKDAEALLVDYGEAPRELHHVTDVLADLPVTVIPTFID